MVAISRTACALLCASAAQVVSALDCPPGQSPLDNKVCCPGPLVMGTNGDACCVPAGDCKPPCLGVKCKAKIDVNDPNYDDKLKDAMGGGDGDSNTSSGSSTSGTATLTPSSTSDSDMPTSTASDSGSSSAGSSSATATPADSGAAVLGSSLLIFGLSALPIVWNSL